VDSCGTARGSISAPDFRIGTVWEGDDQYHQSVEAELVTAERTWSVTGRVLRLIPLRNRRTSPDGEDLVTRISEGLTQWTLDDGRVGYGLSEYLDQIVDGRPGGRGRVTSPGTPDG
jgi:hypothetical protein